jgi:predicted Zn-dependent protease
MRLAAILRSGFIAASIALSSGATHAASPATPPPNYRPALDTAEGGLWFAVDQFEKDLQLSPLLVRDEALNAYVRRIVCDLAGSHCPSLRVYIVNDANMNAFAAPNGMIVVWTGLLLRAHSEAELAFILGHEITHYLKRHTLLNFEKTTRTAGVVALLTVATGGWATIPAALVALGALASYSRDQEREADAGGFELAVGKGYDPRRGALFWAHVREEEDANPRRTKPSAYIASHPAPRERLDTLTRRANELESQFKATLVGEDAHRAVVHPLRAGWLEDELNRGQYAESVAMLGLLLKGDPGSAELHYFAGEAYRRRNGNGDVDTAIAAYRAALAAGNAPVTTYRGLGLVALKAGQREVAREAFENYLMRLPDANDRAMIQLYLTTVGKAQ